MQKIVKMIVFSTALIVCIIVIVFSSIGPKQPTQISDVYTLRAYKNTVALYKNDTMLTVYDDIVLNTLPQSDILAFRKGIAVSSQDEAENILEDYDG